jgi:hypothetical protein
VKSSFIALKLLSIIFLSTLSYAQIPEIAFTYLPSWGSHEDLKGVVSGVNPAGYRVAVFIQVEGGWWTKPTFANPLTIIGSDSSWICDITTGGIDQNATRFSAFLVPQTYDPPLLDGAALLPDTLYQHPFIEQDRPRIIFFSGYHWLVKEAFASPAGPGPNYFSNRIEDLWVDEIDRLHLKISQRNSNWYCTEIISDSSFGYGTYFYFLESRTDTLDINTVVGLFTWDEYAPLYNYREIDVELSRWGEVGNDNAQYVVQPWHHPGNLYRFDIDLNNVDPQTTHLFEWREDEIFFQSLYGHFHRPPLKEFIIDYWNYTGSDNPPAGDENCRINFWLVNGEAPANNQDAEIILSKFEFDHDFSVAIVDHSDSNVPGKLMLYPNFPNPFNSSTTIAFELPEYSHVVIAIYSVDGKRVKTLLNDMKKAGQHSIVWDGKGDNDQRMGSGIYFYTITISQGYSNVKKMIFLK